jgi:hypothetical protein
MKSNRKQSGTTSRHPDIPKQIPYNGKRQRKNA